jgi:hypothetical protein
MTEERPCFACVRFVRSHDGVAMCRRETDVSVISLLLPQARAGGMACGPDGRLFVPTLQQSEPAGEPR